MAKKGSFSKVYDKNGDYADVEAVRFDGTRTVNIQGDVTATQTWNGDSNTALTLNASIGEKKVTTDKINDKAVQTGQIDDGAVGLPQIATSAMTNSATSGDTRLITAGGVRTEIDNAILNRGKDYGPMTPTQINAISEAIPTGSTVHVTAAGTITDGDIEVRQGEDLKYYRSGNTHYWYSMDGDFKLKQQAKTSPTASGNALSFIDSITQDENGEISATKKTVQDGTTSQKGVVQLEDSHSSTSTTKAATPNSVKSAYDLANTANTGAVKNVAYDSTNKKITKTINGTTTDVVSAATLKTDMALNNVDNTSDVNKPVSTAQQAALDLKLDKTGDASNTTSAFTKVSGDTSTMTSGSKLSAIFGAISSFFASLKALAFKDTVSDSDISGTISDNHIASASTWNGKYALPNGGIPKTDLASAVQTSLDKADTALQSHQTVDQNFSTPSSTNPVSTAAVVGYALPKISVEFNREIKTTPGKKLCIGKFPMGDSNLSIVLTDADGIGRYASIVIATQNVNLERGGLYTVSMYGDSSNEVYSRLSVKYSSGSRNFEVYYNWTGNYNRVQCHIRGTQLAGNPTDVMTQVDSIPSDDLVPIVNKSMYATRIGTYASHPSIGTSSIPVYVDINGEVLACTDSFVNNVEYVANQSGGGGNLNKTINGTPTSVLAFMNDSEAVAIWNDAKTAAANAS